MDVVWVVVSVWVLEWLVEVEGGHGGVVCGGSYIWGSGVRGECGRWHVQGGVCVRSSR